MNKLLKLALVFLVLAVIFGAVWFFMKPTEADYSYTLEKALFSVRTQDNLERISTSNELSLVEEEGLQIVYNANCFGEIAQFNYDFYGTELVQDMCGYFILFGYDEETGTPVSYTANELNERLHTVLGHLCRMHGTELNGDFFLFEGTQLLDSNDDTSYQKLMDGDAYLEFGLRDAEGYYWEASFAVMYDGAAILTIEKHYDEYVYDEYIPNITVD